MATSELDQSCWGSTYIILTIIYVCFALLLLISLIPILISFCKNVTKQLVAAKSDEIPTQLKKIMDYSGYCISVLVISSIIIQTVYVIDFCITGHNILDVLTNFNLPLQAVTMLLLWLVRVKAVFMGTQFEISKCVTYSFISVFAILFILATILSFIPLSPQFHDSNSKLRSSILTRERWWMGMMTLAMGYFCSLIALSVLFVYKLVMVYKHVMTNKTLIDLITKITILNFTSIFLTFAMASTMSLYGLYVYARFVNGVALLLDYYTNFWCVMLSYRYFDGYYRKICECCHVKCSDCWLKCIHGTVVTSSGRVAVPTMTIPESSINQTSTI